MNVGQLKELLEEYPDDFGVMIDISAIEGEHEYNVFYDIVDVDENPVVNIIYIVAE